MNILKVAIASAALFCIASTIAFPQDGFPTLDISQEASSSTDDLNFEIDMSEFEDFGSDGFEMQNEMDPEAEKAVAALAIVIAILSVVTFLAILIFAIVIAWQLSSALSAVPEQYREMSPFMPWLIFIPFVNIVVLILAFIKVPQTLSHYLTVLGRNSLGDCGEKLGLWGAILYLLGCTLPIGVVLLVLSLKKIRQAKQLIAQPTSFAA